MTIVKTWVLIEKKWLLTFLHGFGASRAPSRLRETAWWCELSAGFRWWSPAWSRRWCSCASASGRALCSGFPRIWLSVATTTFGRSTCKGSLGLGQMASARASCRRPVWTFYTDLSSRSSWMGPSGLPWLLSCSLWRLRSCFVACTFGSVNSFISLKECNVQLYE